MKYVDDSTIWEVCNRDGSDSVLQTAADQAAQWTDENNKIMEIYFGKKPLNTQPVSVNGTPIECVNVFKLLGITCSNHFNILPFYVSIFFFTYYVCAFFFFFHFYVS